METKYKPATKALSNMDQVGQAVMQNLVYILILSKEFGGTKFKPGIYLMLPNDRHVQV